MKLDLQQASTRLRALRKDLLANYNDENLHQLRITLRRMRGVLRGKPGGKARKLRRQLGALARTTNGARDWDTLYASAQDQLGPDQFRELQPLLHERRENARALVFQMFHAKKWQKTLRRWDAFVDKNELEAGNLRVAPGQLRKRIKRASTAAEKAMARNEDQSWHKLRIAIKELRYALNTRPKKHRSSSHAVLLSECKALQALLGDWHDTVAHRQLLDNLASDGSLNPATPAGEAAAALQQVLVFNGQQSLGQIKQQLREGALAPGAAAGQGHD